MKWNPKTILLMCAAVAALGPSAVLAQGAEIMRRGVVFAGQMHGAESRRDDYDKTALDEMRRAQKEQALGSGLSSADFEAAWAMGYEDARAKMSALSDAERTLACNRLRTAAGMQPRP